MKSFYTRWVGCREEYEKHDGNWVGSVDANQESPLIKSSQLRRRYKFNEFEHSQPTAKDRQETKPSPIFEQTIRNVMKSVHCLPVYTNLMIKLDLQEISKVLGNSSKLPIDHSNGNVVMNSIPSDGSCNQLKYTNDIFLFQKPGSTCPSGADSTIFNNHPNTKSDDSKLQTPEKVPIKNLISTLQCTQVFH